MGPLTLSNMKVIKLNPTLPASPCSNRVQDIPHFWQHNESESAFQMLITTIQATICSNCNSEEENDLVFPASSMPTKHSGRLAGSVLSRA